MLLSRLEVAINLLVPHTSTIHPTHRTTSSWAEDNRILADYKFFGGAPSLSRNQLMVVLW